LFLLEIVDYQAEVKDWIFVRGYHVALKTVPNPKENLIFIIQYKKYLIQFPLWNWMFFPLLQWPHTQFLLLPWLK